MKNALIFATSIVAIFLCLVFPCYCIYARERIASLTAENQRLEGEIERYTKENARLEEESWNALAEYAIDYTTFNDRFVSDEEVEVILTNCEGRLAYYSRDISGSNYAPYPLASNVAEALRLGGTYNVIFSQDDSVYVMTVYHYRLREPEDDVWSDGHKHLLGEESLDYYLDEYATFQAELRQEGDMAEFIDEDATYLLLDKFCADCEFSAENIVE